MSVVWIELGGKRVAPVQAHGRACGTKRREDYSRIECPFRGSSTGCDAPRTNSGAFACADYGDDKFFITEDQLPEYLAAQLLGEAE
ncbi:hypothetical protein [Acidovorax sp. HMWF018]|uniref:hypothetical protein n=1 Tax=Acidovorax sp. HMWF018 TaxID=2056855 RepID=UPI0011B1D7FA|nr:hypothetical protein [Acidovorax sp. HMWF018]